MRTGKPLFIFAMAIVINLGLLYSQLCSIYCDISGCSQSTVVTPAASQPDSSPAHSECEHHKHSGENAHRETGHSHTGTPVQSEGHNHSHQPHCAFHTDVTWLLSSGANMAAQSQPDAHPDAAASPLAVVISFARPAGETGAQTPDRSPPRRVTSVLRI